LIKRSKDGTDTESTVISSNRIEFGEMFRTAALEVMKHIQQKDGEYHIDERRLYSI
jgi:hypothetical protein